ncbi:MAG: lysogenization protein HflD [Pseudomonadota bacterium]
MKDPIMQDRVTALAAVFQAASLVESIANGNGAPPRELALSINSLFALDASQVAEIYPADAPLATGRAQLRAVLRREAGGDSTHRINYVMAMMQLAGILRSDPALQHTVRERLLQIRSDTGALDDRSTDDVIAKIAALYVDTFGGLRFRVQVKGEPRQLQMPEVAARIRACLFAGIRAAHLWHHLGGRRWHLLFGAGKMLDALD